MRIAQSVRKLTPYTPGEQPKDARVIKLNTNENPYPPSPRVAQVLASFDTDRLRRYPDPVFTALRERLAVIHGTVPEKIFIGNGSDEVLTLAARAFVDDTEAIGAFDPSYSLYQTLAAIRNVPFVPTPLDDRFGWTDPVTDRVALFLLTNPNAPTSCAVTADRIRPFAARFPGVVLIDEAYADFADAHCMTLATAAENENVIVMRTLSKSFSLAGLRLGYCVGPVDLIEALYKVKDSYNINALSQAVALAALEDLPWMRAHVERVRATRRRLTDALRQRGWDVPDSQTNFLFARPARRPAADLFEALRQRHIYVRYFPGARTGDRLRITIGTEEETDAFLAAIDALDTL